MAKRSKKKKVASEILSRHQAGTKNKFVIKPELLSWKRALQVSVIVAAVFFIYWPALHGDWFWDDDLYVTKNSLLHRVSGLWKILLDPQDAFDYYPATASVEWIQWHLWGMDTLGYHLTNVVLHIVSSLLVWRLLGKFGLKLAWLGGLLFAIHPVMVESVVWIAELKNTLSLPFFLGALICWIDYEESAQRRDYLLALGLFLVAMLSKPAMAAFPIVILLYAWWKRDRIKGKDLMASAPFVAISMVLGLVTIWSTQRNQPHAMMGDQMPTGGIGSRLAVSGLMLDFDFSKAFLPMGLLPLYPSWTVDPPSLFQFLPWPILAGVIYYLWTKRASWGRHALLGLGFFFLMLAPVLYFVATNYATMVWSLDHLGYLPMIGLIGLTIAGLEQFQKLVPSFLHAYGFGIMVLIAVLLTWKSHQYAGLFINQETLWTYTLRYNPNSYVAHDNLGYALAQTGRVTEAEEQYQQALDIYPDDADAHSNLGAIYLRTARVEEAVQQLEQALKIKSDSADSHFNLGVALQRTGHVADAIEQYEQALKINPDYGEAYINLANALMRTGRTAEALAQYGLGLQLKSDDAVAHYNYAFALMQAGRLSEAAEQYEEALVIQPDFVQARNNLAKVQATLQQSIIPER